MDWIINWSPVHTWHIESLKNFLLPSLRFIRPSQIPRTGKSILLIFHCYFKNFTFFNFIGSFWLILIELEAKPVDNLNRNETVIAIDLSPSMAGWGGLEEAKEISISKLDKMEGAVGLITFDHSKFETLEVGTGNKFN